MAKRHGVGFQIQPWGISWGPHARAWKPGVDACPAATVLRPLEDPWLKLSPPDPDHLISRSIIPANLWAPYLGLHPAQRCWMGGAAGVDPHNTTAGPLLVAAFNAGKLGDPAEWDGTPNEQELHLMSVSAAAYNRLRQLAGVPQPPPPQPPPVEPPSPQPPPQPPPSDGLERRVASLENWRTTSMDPNTLNQHPDFVDLVEVFKRRVEALEALDIQHRLEELEAGEPPAPPPAPPQPPAPPPQGEAPAVTMSFPAFTATAAQPHRLLKVPFTGLARRITLSYRVDIPEVAAGQRQQVHAAYVDGSGRHGILSLLFVDGGRRSWVLRTNSAGASQPWVTATKAGLRPEEASAYAVRQDWMPGDNRVVAGSDGETTDRPLLALRMREGLWIDLGYPAASVEGNPAEAYSLGWTWSDLEVKIWE